MINEAYEVLHDPKTRSRYDSDYQQRHGSGTFRHDVTEEARAEAREARAQAELFRRQAEAAEAARHRAEEALQRQAEDTRAEKQRNIQVTEEARVEAREARAQAELFRRQAEAAEAARRYAKAATSPWQGRKAVIAFAMLLLAAGAVMGWGLATQQFVNEPQLRQEQASLQEAQQLLKTARQQLEEDQKHLTIARQKLMPEKTLTNSVGIEFVLIPAGTFQMGSDEQKANDAKPLHTVHIKQPFYLGKYEVTQDQWQKLMGRNPSKFQDNPNLPVENISWEDVQEFIRQLNVKEGGAHYRLPTEAEWEYAARGSDGRVFPWEGSFDPSRLKFCDPNCQTWWSWLPFGKKTTTAPVGSYPSGQSPFGVHDIAGNVWEWVQDWFGPYTADAALNPAGPSSGVERVCRGGGWRDQAEFFRMARRQHFPPGHHSDDRGFRLFRDVRQPLKE